MASSICPDDTLSVSSSEKLLILKRISRKMESFTATIAMNPMEQRAMGIMVIPPLIRKSNQDVGSAVGVVTNVESGANSGADSGVVSGVVVVSCAKATADKNKKRIAEKQAVHSAC